MKPFVKYGIVPVATFGFLVVVTMILLPVVLNVQRFAPRIEQEVSTLIARPVSIGPDFTLSFFPRLSISCSDLRIGNQSGFRSDDFLRIDSFEARMKVLPLLRGRIEFSRFVIGGLTMNLESNSDGRVNWKNSDRKLTNDVRRKGLPSLLHLLTGIDQADLFVITDGTVNWNDRMRNQYHQATDVMVVVHDFSFQHQVNAEIKMVVDEHPFSLEGSFGPAKPDNSEHMKYSFHLLAEKEIYGNIQGDIEYRGTYSARAHLKIEPFKLSDILGFSRKKRLGAETEIFQSFSLDTQMFVDSTSFQVKSALVGLDESKLDCTLDGEFNKKNIQVSCAVDQLDFDPYLKELMTKNKSKVTPVQGIGKKEASSLGYSVDGSLFVTESTLAGVRFTNLKASLSLADGRLVVDPLEAELYGGHLTGITLDSASEKDGTETPLEIRFIDVDAQPFFSDLIGWSFLSGRLAGTLDILVGRYDDQAPYHWIGGSGQLSLTDGSLRGIVLGGEQEDAIKKSDDEKPLSEKQTSFEHLDLSLNFGEGLLSLGDGTMEVGGMHVIIGGVADLKSHEIDLLFTPVGLRDAGQTVAMKGALDAPGWYTIQDAGTTGGGGDGKISVDINKLVERQLPSPPDAHEKGLVGKTLMDPKVVAQRIGLQPMKVIAQPMRDETTTTKRSIRIKPLRLEETFQ